MHRSSWFAEMKFDPTVMVHRDLSSDVTVSPSSLQPRSLTSKSLSVTLRHLIGRGLHGDAFATEHVVFFLTWGRRACADGSVVVLRYAARHPLVLRFHESWRRHSCGARPRANLCLGLLLAGIDAPRTRKCCVHGRRPIRFHGSDGI